MYFDHKLTLNASLSNFDIESAANIRDLNLSILNC